MLLFKEETMRTSLMPFNPRNKRINLKMRKTLKAGIRSETAVNQFLFKKITLVGAKTNLIRKSIIK
jgi:hypothetical protein